ncbi:MAG: glutaredoxin family protein [Abditibacteriales bacterium]|nr:glutaredoxin family protein [Abditibacteriales bacterium]
MKEYLSQKGVAFTDRNVTADAEAMDELMKLGYMSIPVTVVDGKTIVGFNRRAIDAALAE